MAKEVFDFAGTDDIAGLKELWYRCFDIDGAYGDFYFQNRFVPEDTLICRKNEQIAAMLTLAEVAISGERGYYLYALATLPEFRNQGIMRAMIRRSEEEIRRRNGTFSCLRPVSSDLFSMYEKLDYETDFFRFFGTLKREEAEKAIFSFRLCEFEDFYRRRLDYLKKQKNPVTHSRKEHLFIYRDLEKSGGGVVLYEEDGKEQYIAYTCGKD
ncbi:MAG: GNAT family N-acetyltransferase, partial [Oscillospiraceae bacterium]